MIAEYTKDPAGVIESIFYRMFHPLFHSAGARRHLSFSQINFYSNAHGFPGWHLWFDGKPGAYQLELVEEEFIEHKTENAEIRLPVRGRFVVRYFPDEEEHVFNTFSCYEQMLRISSLFDNTGTPTPQGREQLHPSYFTIGYVDVRTNQDRDILELECFAPQRWRDIRVDGLLLKNDEENEYEAVHPGDIDRNVPGWELCFFLFDKLFSGFCHVYKQPPVFVALAKTNGKVFMIDAHNNVEEKETRDFSQVYLVASMKLIHGTEGKPADKVDKVDTERSSCQVRDLLESYGSYEIRIYETPDPDCGQWINPQWWDMGGLHFHGEEEEHCCYHDH